MIKSWGDQRLPGAAGAEFPGAGGGGRRKGIEVGSARGGRVMLGRCWDCDQTILIWCLDDNSVGQILQKVKLKFAKHQNCHQTSLNITTSHYFMSCLPERSVSDLSHLSISIFYSSILFYLHLKESYQGVPIDWEGNTLREYEGKMGCWRRSWEPWLGSRWLTGENTGCPRRLSRAIGNLAEEEAAWGYCLSNAIITPHPRKLL